MKSNLSFKLISKKKGTRSLRASIVIRPYELISIFFSCPRNCRLPLGLQSFVLGQNSMGYTEIFLGFRYTLFAREINNF